MSAVMDGTGLVADELYLLAHHEVTGKPLLERRPLSIGLAGGLLAELMLGGGISLRDDGAVMAHRAWPGDDLGRRVRDQIAAEQESEPVREWLLFLARSAMGDVARRLEQSGHLMRAGRRVSWRPGRWVPVDDDWAVEAVLRVRVGLDPSRLAASHEAVLAGLAVVCGLGFRFKECQKAAGGVEEAVGKLRLELQDLIAETRAAMQSPATAPAERSAATHLKRFASLRLHRQWQDGSHPNSSWSGSWLDGITYSGQLSAADGIACLGGVLRRR